MRLGSIIQLKHTYNKSVIINIKQIINNIVINANKTFTVIVFLASTTLRTKNINI